METFTEALAQAATLEALSYLVRLPWQPGPGIPYWPIEPVLAFGRQYGRLACIMDKAIDAAAGRP